MLVATFLVFYLFLCNHAGHFKSKKQKVAKMIPMPNGEVKKCNNVAIKFISNPFQPFEYVTKRIKLQSYVVYNISKSYFFVNVFVPQLKDSMTEL